MYVHGFRQGSGSPGLAVGSSTFHVAGAVLNPTGVTLAVQSHTLYAVPFFSPRAGQVDRIGFRVTGAVADSFAKVAIYGINSLANFYPHGLLLVASRATTATGLNMQSIVASFNQGTLYWFALISNASITVRALDSTDLFPIFGYDSASAYPRSMLVASCNASTDLPQIFPTSATTVGSDGPTIGVRYISMVP